MQGSETNLGRPLPTDVLTDRSKGRKVLPEAGIELRSLRDWLETLPIELEKVTSIGAQKVLTIIQPRELFSRIFPRESIAEPMHPKSMHAKFALHYTRNAYLIGVGPGIARGAETSVS